MKFSIIIPNYNKGQFIGECLDSIINQTLNKENYEIIVIDDKSDDNSLEVIKNYDVKLFHVDRKMAGGARNKGLDNANGEYIVFLDSDDKLVDNTVLERLFNLIDNEDIINLSYVRESKENNEIVHIDKDMNTSISEKIASSRLLGCPTKCFKASLLENIRFDEECYYEDTSFTIEALCNAKTQKDFEGPFFVYRYVYGSITRSKEISAKKMTDVLIQIVKFYYFCDKFPEHKDALLKRIKKDRLPERLEILNNYFETGYNAFYDVF